MFAGRPRTSRECSDRGPLATESEARRAGSPVARACVSPFRWIRVYAGRSACCGLRAPTAGQLSARFECSQADSLAVGVDKCQCAWLQSQKLRQLGRGGLQRAGSLLDVHLASGQNIQRFCEERREVFVLRVDPDASCRTAAAPLEAGDFGFLRYATDLECEIDAQAEQGLAMVLRRTAPLTGLGLHAARQMRDNDRCFDLVAMLAARPATASAAEAAEFLQLTRTQRRRMDGGWRFSGRATRCGRGGRPSCFNRHPAVHSLDGACGRATRWRHRSW